MKNTTAQNNHPPNAFLFIFNFSPKKIKVKVV
jgi:hypothetical protein